MSASDPSTTARWKRSIRFTSAWSMIGTCGARGSLPATGLPGDAAGHTPGRRSRRPRRSPGPHPHVDPRLVHHLEHAAESLWGSPTSHPRQSSLSPKASWVIGAPRVAEFMVDSHAGHVVADKPAPASGVFSGPRRARSLDAGGAPSIRAKSRLTTFSVDSIVGTGDEDLLPLDFVRASACERPSS